MSVKNIYCKHDGIDKLCSKKGQVIFAKMHKLFSRKYLNENFHLNPGIFSSFSENMTIVAIKKLATFKGNKKFH
jgi:hypothetical protein